MQTNADGTDEPRLLSFRQYTALLTRYLSPQLGEAALLAALLFGQVGLQLANPQIIRHFIDRTQAGGEMTAVAIAAGLFVAIALAVQLVSVLAQYVGQRVGWTATNRLRADLTRHCLMLDMSFHNRRTPGEMIERIDGDANQLGAFFSTFAADVVGNVLMLVGIVALLFREDWRAGLPLTLFAALSLVVLSLLRNSAVERHKATREASTSMFGFLEERLVGIEDIRTSGAKPYVLRRFREHVRRWFHARLESAMVVGAVINVTSLLFVAGGAVALATGAWPYLEGGATIGTVYLIFHYTGMLRAPIRALSFELDTLQQATASLVRVNELFSTRTRAPDGPGAEMRRAAPSVSLADVSFGYGGETVLTGVSFELAPNRVLGLLGRTGSGKTTLARLLLRLYAPDSGVVRLDGIDVRRMAAADLGERAGMVPQDVRLFQGTVRDNLTFFDRSVPDAKLLETIDALQLRPWLDGLPLGLDTELRSDGGGLSAGEAQLLGFARVFLRDVGLVVLDEASSRLDRGTERLIEGAVENLLSGRTAIIVAHHLATLRRVDEIMILEGGRIVEHGDREALANDPDSRFHGLLRTGLEEVLV